VELEPVDNPASDRDDDNEDEEEEEEEEEEETEEGEKGADAAVALKPPTAVFKLFVKSLKPRPIAMTELKANLTSEHS
jgi:hypothetical protein